MENRYDTTILIRLSKNQKEKIKDRATSAGYGERELSKYIRDIALNGKIIDFSELRELTKTINRIGNNVNQATKIMNTYFDFTGEDFNYISAEVTKIRELVEKYCNSKK